MREINYEWEIEYERLCERNFEWEYVCESERETEGESVWCVCTYVRERARKIV